MRRPASTLPPPTTSGAVRDWRVIARLLPHLWPADAPALRLRLVLSMGVLLLAKLAGVVVPLFYKHAVDALSVPERAAIVLPLGVIAAYGLARLGNLAFTEIRDLLFARVVERAIHVLSLRTFRHLHGLSLRFHLDRQTGGLSRVIERGTRAIEVVLRQFVLRAGPSLIELVMVCGVLWTLYDWTYAVVMVGALAVYVAWTLAITEWRLDFRRSMNTHDAEASSKAIDSLINYETVKYFGNEEHEAKRFDRALSSYEEVAVKSHRSLSLLNIGQSAIISLSLVAVMIMAAVDIRGGRMTPGDFVLVNTYLLQLYVPLNFLGMVYREVKQGLVDMEVLFGLIDRPPEVADPANAADLVVRGGAVRFEGVRFAYNPEREVLKGVSLEIPAGGTLAVVGHSGAGKSTLSRLLFRFYDVTGGRVLIDGQDLRDVTQASLRRAIGIVPQDTVLFNDTIGYNIAYGRPGASRQEVERAARLAAIHDFVQSLKNGYDTQVGERGLKLSGGEKQRVAIARTILKDPAILILDEATSALDSHTEREIQGALRDVSRGRTTLVIAHRLSTVIDADRILVLDGGRVAESGSHDDLLRAEGLYAALWRKQQQSSSLAVDEEADTILPAPA
ncbi:metal ABC transporter permease [Rhodospirillum rubrum]|uniref:ABCB family ABC transporter ATP-binding protein/permease n=1 Tax=Rhodospirillum rubrum TaxID=1085 RepID=UPI0019079C14|nr:ABC transporter ATP-binding protein/permease [Rhodospirillum rubrum]MBK1664301.1 metal ABC transporter permease [Rhodospirillum rubrum]MBK1675904.1 metal ABC transporter permease [Rhodospirillum rubrum]